MRAPLVLLGLQLAAGVGPVAKVIQLLDELSAKVTADGEAELAEFTEFSQWCAVERRDKEHSIADSKRSIKELSATAESSRAAVDQLQTKVGEVSTAISANEEELAKAKQLRETEAAQFQVTDTELTETVDTLVRAQSVLGKHRKEASLLEVQANLGKVAQNLAQIVQASWVNTNQKSQIEAFLQKPDDDDDLSLSPAALVQQPQASVSAYNSHSSGILDTLADLQEKAEAAQSEARREEMKAGHAHKMLVGSLEAELKAQTKQLEDAKKIIASNQEAQSEAEGDLSATKRTLAQDEKVIAELKQSCQDKAQEWEASQKGRAEELEALHNAKAVLGQAPGEPNTFVQLRARTHLRARSRARARARLSSETLQKDSAVQYLQRLARKLNSVTLAQVAVSVGADPFEKVKTMIEDLVAKLMAEQSEAVDRKAWCDSEMSKTTAARDDKNAKLEVSHTRIEKAEAASAKLAEAVNKLNRELSAMDAGQAEATKLRQEEHTNFAAASKDYADGQEACAGAITVLRNYYEGGDGSFLQLTGNGDAAHSIIGLLEVAESDFSRMEADARAAESAAQAAYDKNTLETKVTRAAKTAEVKAKATEMKQLNSEAGNYKQDRQGVQKELDAVLQYQDKLAPECEVKVSSFEETQERRKHELEGLQNALQILDGKALALLETRAVVRKVSLRGA
jgi:chromosome segregation ATPase